MYALLIIYCLSYIFFVSLLLFTNLANIYLIIIIQNLLSLPKYLNGPYKPLYYINNDTIISVIITLLLIETTRLVANCWHLSRYLPISSASSTDFRPFKGLFIYDLALQWVLLTDLAPQSDFCGVWPARTHSLFTNPSRQLQNKWLLLKQHHL